MKKKALVLAVCMAFATPTISVAEALPSNLVGLSLGEMQSQSFLNEPFKGIIPILFADIEASKNLKVRLASKSIFQKIGAEKLPILNNLKFKIIINNQQPSIYIESTQPIRMPFLNFVLEIEGPQGSIYQDFTTLLDPKEKHLNLFDTEESYASLLNVGSTEKKPTINMQYEAQQYDLLVASLSSPVSSPAVIKDNKRHTVKSGDTLSQIALALNAAEVSLKKVISAIHLKNPNAFINNNINRLKIGAVLQFPSQGELKNSNFKTAATKATLEKKVVSTKVNATNVTNSQELDVMPEDAYIIKKGDTLSKITKELGHKSISFTKMMKAIHTANSHAFSKNKINLLIIGKILRIPSLEEVSPSNQNTTAKKQRSGHDSSGLETLDKSAAEKIIEPSKEFALNGFIVEKGDTLASITKEIGYENISHADMMKAIYITNSDAFDKNNITTLIEGAIIRLPSIAEMEEIKKGKTNSEKTKTRDNELNTSSSDNTESSNQTLETNNSIVLNKLEKRVRELKRDLDKASSNFSQLESALISKETIIKEQSESLRELTATLASFGKKPITPIFVENEKTLTKGIDNSAPLAILSKATVQPDVQKTSQKKVPKNIKAITQKSENELFTALTNRANIPANFSEKFTDNIKKYIVDYSAYMSDKELLNSVLALLFGLLLIRYRRVIYAYTKISYDYPKYYPPFEEKDARAALKEKSISFQDTLTDDHYNKNNLEFSNELIQECEELVEELIDDMDVKTSIHHDNVGADWEDLDKACDEYISEFKSESKVTISETDDSVAVENPESEPEEMTFELFEALAEGAIKESNPDFDSEKNNDSLMYSFDNEISSSHEKSEEVFSSDNKDKEKEDSLQWS